MENKKRWRQCGQNSLARVWPRLGSVSDCEAHLEGVAANPRRSQPPPREITEVHGGTMRSPGLFHWHLVLRKLSKYVYFIQNWNFCGAVFSFTGFVVTFLLEYGIKINFSLEQGPFFLACGLQVFTGKTKVRCWQESFVCQQIGSVWKEWLYFFTVFNHRGNVVLTRFHMVEFCICTSQICIQCRSCSFYKRNTTKNN